MVRQADHLRSRICDQPGQHGDAISTKNKKINWEWWQAPVIQLLGRRLRQENHLNLRRLQWAEITPLLSSLWDKSKTSSQKKKKLGKEVTLSLQLTAVYFISIFSFLKHIYLVKIPSHKNFSLLFNYYFLNILDDGSNELVHQPWQRQRQRQLEEDKLLRCSIPPVLPGLQKQRSSTRPTSRTWSSVRASCKTHLWSFKNSSDSQALS